MKNSFILYTEQKAVIDKLTDEQAGKLIKAIYAHETGEEMELDAILDLVITPFLTSLERNTEKYQKRVETNKKNIAKRWNEDDTKNTNGKNGIQNYTNDTNGNDSDNDSVSDNDSDLKEEVVQEEKPTAAAWVSCYENNIGLIPPMVFEEIDSYELADEVVEEAIKEAVKSDVRKPKYICAILKEFKEHNIKTKADVVARQVEREKTKNKDKPPNKPTSAYINPAQKEFEDLSGFYAN